MVLPYALEGDNEDRLDTEEVWLLVLLHCLDKLNFLSSQIKVDLHFRLSTGGV